MCGIVAYVGHRQAAEFLIDGLRRLEYRGYDSAGLATVSSDRRIHIVKAVGRIDALAEKLKRHWAPGTVGVGHTRWATHGVPNEVNAHPHRGGDDAVVLAHNGVIENYRVLKERLEEEGYEFVSATDTEAIAHLIASCLAKHRAQQAEGTQGESCIRDPYAIPIAAINEATGKLRGTYGLAILLRDYPGVIFAARQGSPLVVGVGHGEYWVASDASPLAGRTDKIVYLADRQLAVITADSLQVLERDLGIVAHAVESLEMEVDDVGLEGFPHYMLKEIYEQPDSLTAAMRGRLSDVDATAVFGGLNLTPQQLRNVNRIVLTACGTSWHAAMVGEYLIEELARIPVEVEYASELRYRNPPVEQGTLLFALTQSGETADTLAALREMKRKGHPSLAICNVVGSTIAHEADGGVYLHAGPEIGVASTKAYTSQVAVMTMLALYFGRLRHLSYEAGQRIITQLRKLPDLVRETLEVNGEVRRIAAKYAHANNFLYLGRQFNFPTALEGALKLKEISYIHAEGYPAAEMKHGPIALVDQHTPSVFLMPQGGVYDKVMSNLEEIKARGGPVIAIAAKGDKEIARLADDVIYVPVVEEFLSPLINIVPLQLLAYHVAVHRGCDVDKPRNLAKSVTVE
ncbi:Glutamine--fructose-6-phosphate aminotransferase [isomerizing] [Anatilimnocola aggregata]|uniref:Glutamine--fructose-6-phosphate aminotransferase [isomerizing] n=1 Tax=Anatilimnocola aggregata TaxID=2528021 RepID=A0A517Y996_9BACT|nr:glutamine--fructose-6-phosphate transaminase (isomerizing) [Anatilimnocola aggregata]QDU26800.1 Glutamine--fructose-6-phosphate aminotransferase [isomerizing] [Anatilimnocola aggregata]